MTGSVPLDLAASPCDNLYAFGKTWGDVRRGAADLHVPRRHVRLGGTSRLQPLFGYAGTGITKVRFVGKGASERLPWAVYGDEVLLEWDYAHESPNPVTPSC